MKNRSALLIAFLVGVLASEAALAHGRPGRHSRVHVGFHFGIPVAAPLFFHPYRHYYYPPPVYVTPPAPQTWIERESAAPSPPDAWWYYCPEARAYYPYVGQCAGGWQRVAPQPPSG